MERNPQQLSAESLRQQYDALLAMSESLAKHRDLPVLFRNLAQQLRTVVEFDGVATFLHDAARNTMRIHLLETTLPGLDDLPEEEPLEQTAAGMVWRTQQPLFIADITADTTATDQRIRAASWCAFSLHSAADISRTAVRCDWLRQSTGWDLQRKRPGIFAADRTAGCHRH